MKPLSVGLIVLPFVAVTAFSQPTPLPPPQGIFPQIRQFLGLTDTQLSAILQNNSDYNAFSSQQQQLIRNAQTEIAVQTAKDQLDPMAIGTLYAGIESACRDLRDKAAASRQQNLSVLTDAQKAKLNMLSDAIKLFPVISEAQSGNLLGSPNSPPYSFSSYSSGIITGVTGFPPVSGCSVGGVIGGIIVPVPVPQPAPAPVVGPNGLTSTATRTR